MKDEPNVISLNVLQTHLDLVPITRNSFANTFLSLRINYQSISNFNFSYDL